jgi:outer membrane receptor protein involved in Fe transport
MSRSRGRAVTVVLSLIVFSFVAATDALAQGGAVRGRVVALETDTPLGSANVVLRQPGQAGGGQGSGTGVVASATADAAGRFQMVGVKPGRYMVEVSFISYAPHTAEVTVEAGKVVDLGAIRLAVQAIALEAVTASVERPQAVYAPDRDIYSTESLPAAAGGVATELMSSIPELEVDFDGSIILRGSSPQIYINGRPAPMDGEALAAFLEQFPADRIERIEVIANPSARFSSEGSGGIVNIVLKEGVDLGANGSIFANSDTRGATGLGGQVSVQRGRLLVSAGGSVRGSDQETTGYDLRQNLREEPHTFLRQDNWSDQNRLSGNGRLNTELRLGEGTLLRGRGSFSGFGSDTVGSTTTTHLYYLEEPTRRYDRHSLADSRRRTLDFMLGFSHAFVPERHTLEFEVGGRSGRNRSDREVRTEFELIDPLDPLLPADLMLEDNLDRNRELSLRLDYVRPWGEAGQFEVGYRGSLDTREDERLLELVQESPDGRTEESTLRGFTHDQTFHTGYLTLMRRIGAFGVQLGGRARWLETRFEVPTGEAFETSGVDFFPSANLTYEFDEGRRLRFSYSRRTRRPPASRLNPIDQSTDPLNREVGNPDLEPQYTHSFGLDASSSMPWGTLRLSPYFRRVTNDWARIQTVDQNGVSTRTWENLASQDQYGASLTASVRGPNRWGGFVSLSGRGERRDAGNLAAAISEHSFHWSIRGNVSGEVVGGLGLRANLSYTPARDVAQGRVGSRVDSSIGLRQRLLDGRLSLSLTAQDPFDISRSTFESRDPTFVQLGRSQITRRTVRLGASYSFGAGGGGGGRGGGGSGRR